MIHRVVILSALAIAAAVSAPGLLAGSGFLEPETAPVAVRSEPPATTPSPGRRTVLKANAGGHFEGRFMLNGKAVDGLVDTGATFVSLNRSTARRIGFNPAPSAFTHRVRTANGVVRVAPITLRRVTIGSIRLRDVDAVILENDSLKEALIGMSFLRRLRSWRVESGRLVLSL